MNINEAFVTVSDAVLQLADRSEHNFRVIEASIAQLNDIMVEIAAGVSEDPDWVDLVRQKLSESSWALGHVNYAGQPGDPELFMKRE